MSQKFPEAPGRRAAVLLTLCAVFAGVLALFLWKIHALERQLARERQAAEAGLAERDAINRELAKELELLDKQAALTQWRMAELEQLEREMRRLAGRARLIASIGGVPAAGAGGQYVAFEPPAESPDADAIRARFERLLADAAAMRDSYRLTLANVSSLDERLRQTPLLWPTDSRQINSGFGYRRDPFTGSAAHHNGVDIDGSKGEPVYAAADGIVREAGENGAHGLQIVIDHGAGFATAYSHLNALYAEAGQSVRQGEPIGEIGTSGRSTGPHLHYEIWLDGEQVDPQDYLLIGRDALDRRD